MNTVKLIGLALIGLSLVRCSGGGGDPPVPASHAAQAPAPAPTPTPTPTPPPPPSTSQPDLLVATAAGLWRGQATGHGGLILNRANLQQSRAVLTGAHVVYARKGPNDLQEILWTVRTDGAGDHQLFTVPVQSERVLGVSGPWVVASKWMPDGTAERWSARPDTGEQFFLSNEGSFISDVFIATQGTDRVIPFTSFDLYSISLRGTNRIDYGFVRGDNASYIGVRAVGDAVVFGERGEPPTSPPSVMFAVPASGGARVQFESDQFYTYSAGLIGARLIYQRCSGDYPNLFACDVLSANPDNTGKDVLAGEPANEVVQGVTTQHVIIRRNLAGNDHLIAVPVTGGPERLLMTMTDTEFVDTTVGDLVIVRRPTGTWTVDLNSTLKQIGTKPGLDFFKVVGDAICSNMGEVWCLPLDGSRAEVRIDHNGTVVGVL